MSDEITSTTKTITATKTIACEPQLLNLQHVSLGSCNYKVYIVILGAQPNIFDNGYNQHHGCTQAYKMILIAHY